jgi:hypothetical protein
MGFNYQPKPTTPIVDFNTLKNLRRVKAQTTNVLTENYTDLLIDAKITLI